MNRNTSRFLSQVKKLIEVEEITITYNESNEHQLLGNIKVILENDKLEDFQCVEEIVCAFEAFGDGIAWRHDF